jgi:hypothetical protein
MTNKKLSKKEPEKEMGSSLRKDFDEFSNFVSTNVFTKKDFEKFEGSMISFKHRMYNFISDMEEFRKEIREFKMETREDARMLGEKIDEIKPSAKSLDKILEQYPIERIVRLEKHSKLPEFSPAV